MGTRHRIFHFGTIGLPFMRLNTFLVPLTIGLFIYTIVTVVNHINNSSKSAPVDTPPSGDGVSTAASSERSLLATSKSLLVTGVSSKIPVAKDYKLLTSVPWDMREIGKLYRDAGVEMACEMLETGVDVLQPLLEFTPNTAGPLGRRCAFSIRLQVGKELGSGIPSVTRGIIEDYLKARQLTIQTTFYHDEKGRLILGPVLRAALVVLETPDKVSSPEPMIAKSVEEFRTLGAYWNESEPFEPGHCRTLILGFRYTLDADMLVAKPNPQREYEVLFLHLLPESTLLSPKLAVFATSDARTQFHLLEESDPESVEQLSAITADVRFADVKLMGMLPETPVVTRVRHRALLSVPIDIVKSQMEGVGGKIPGGFSGILDDLYRRATSTDAPAASPDVNPSNSDSSGTPPKADEDFQKSDSSENGSKARPVLNPGFDA